MAKFHKTNSDAPAVPTEDMVIASNPFDDPPNVNKSQHACNPIMPNFMPPNSVMMSQRRYFLTARPPPPYAPMMAPSPMPSPMHHHVVGPSMISMMEQRVYPPEQAMIRSTNPNAPPIYICRCCRLEIHDNDQTIYCGSECKRFFHRSCVGLHEDAWHMLNNEAFAEWICDLCFVKRGGSLVHLPPSHQTPATCSL